MGRRCRTLKALLVLAAWCLGAAAAPATARVLRVCADPNNLPYSNAARAGFENRIIELVASEMGADVEYVWRAQRRGYVREALNGGQCDVLPGVASNLETVLTTRPYYRSSYVFVWRADRPLALSSLDDRRLGDLIIGVQMVGDDFSNTPPAHALARRGRIANVRGYMIYGDYSTDTPQAPILRAVEGGAIDVAIVWGPLAGYFSQHAMTPLALAPVEPAVDPPGLPMTFEISMGVRRSDAALRGEINRALIAATPEIQRVLNQYGVPQLSLTD